MFCCIFALRNYATSNKLIPKQNTQTAINPVVFILLLNILLYFLQTTINASCRKHRAVVLTVKKVLPLTLPTINYSGFQSEPFRSLAPTCGCKINQFVFSFRRSHDEEFTTLIVWHRVTKKKNRLSKMEQKIKSYPDEKKLFLL